MVNDHPSTAISCVDAGKMHEKNINVNKRVFGCCVLSSLPNQLSTFIDMKNKKIPRQNMEK
jgi:hypothetical protein